MILTILKKPIAFLPPRLITVMFLLCVLLTGCTRTPSKPPIISQDWAKHETQIQSKNNWQAIGKLGVKVPNDGGSANLRWTQQSDIYQIDLNGPFGQGKLSIEGQPGKVTLTEAGESPRSAKTAEELITKTTGWNIPVTQLAYWVRGLPAPDLKITRFQPNTQGLLGELEQAGWKIVYGDYLSVASVDNAIAMPARITAEYKDVKLTLVIREWNFNPLDTPERQP